MSRGLGYESDPVKSYRTMTAKEARAERKRLLDAAGPYKLDPLNCLVWGGIALAWLMFIGSMIYLSVN